MVLILALPVMSGRQKDAKARLIIDLLAILAEEMESARIEEDGFEIIVGMTMVADAL